MNAPRTMGRSYRESPPNTTTLADESFADDAHLVNYNEAQLRCRSPAAELARAQARWRGVFDER